MVLHVQHVGMHYENWWVDAWWGGVGWGGGGQAMVMPRVGSCDLDRYTLFISQLFVFSFFTSFINFLKIFMSQSWHPFTRRCFPRTGIFTSVNGSIKCSLWKCSHYFSWNSWNSLWVWKREFIIYSFLLRELINFHLPSSQSWPEKPSGQTQALLPSPSWIQNPSFTHGWLAMQASVTLYKRKRWIQILIKI